MRSTLLAAAIGLAFLGSANAADRPLQTALAQISAHSTAAGQWASLGGDVEFQFNPDRLLELGITIKSVDRAVASDPGEPGVRYATVRLTGRRSAALLFAVRDGKPDELRGGALTYDGGFVLALPKGGELDMRGLRIQPSGRSVFGLDVSDTAGNVWFTLDHAHFDLGHDRTRFRLRDMNLRISARFADRIGRPELADTDIGGADVETDVSETGVDQTAGTCANTWPAPGLNTDIAVFYGTDTWTGHPDTIVIKRCNVGTSGACTTTSGTSGNPDGDVVVSPDSSLRNVGNTAVTWHSMFSGNFAPYNNDQHPFLVWNLYRFDANGGVKQIGVSGVKHAFETVNYNCSCSDFNIIYPSCEDTYSTNNNDTSGVLGPRTELIPSKGIWGRCGSVYDSDCNGAQGPSSGASNLHQYRLNARESEMLPANFPGATYYMEYWYIVRDDQNIYNTMGNRQLTLTKGGTSWSVSSNAATFVNGPALSRWVDPANPPAGTANREVVTNEGRARVAVKTSSLGNGQYRYEYAVMNFDFAHAVIDPAHATEPNLKLTSNTGFETFAVPFDNGATISNVTFADTDTDAANDWTATTTGGKVQWSAPVGNTLNWGTMFRFGFTSNVAPGLTTANLGLAANPTGYGVQTLTPSDIIFAWNTEPTQ